MPQWIRRGTVGSFLLLTTTAICEEARDLSEPKSPPRRALTSTEWRVIPTANFRIHYTAAEVELARHAAVKSEVTRARIMRDWFSSESAADWPVQCDVFIHRTAASYAAGTRPHAPTPGYSSVTWRRGRVASRRIDLLNDGSDLVEAVLPHEVSHVIFAGLFGDASPPLWVDEGVAVLAEKPETRHAHERNLGSFVARGRWFSAQQLMHMKNYPAEHDRGLFYAQSVSLVDFLVRDKGPHAFLEFVRGAATSGYEREMQRIYGYSSYSQLEEKWSRHVRTTFAAQRTPRSSREAVRARTQQASGNPNSAVALQIE